MYETFSLTSFIATAASEVDIAWRPVAVAEVKRVAANNS
jgi:hypothetical protein